SDPPRFFSLLFHDERLIGLEFGRASAWLAPDLLRDHQVFNRVASAEVVGDRQFISFHEAEDSDPAQSFTLPDYPFTFALAADGRFARIIIDQASLNLMEPVIHPDP